MTEIPANSFYVMSGIIGILVLASIVCILLRFKNPQVDYTELRQRIQSWWVMIALLFFVLIISETASLIFFGFLSFLAFKEFLSIVPIRHADRPVIFWAYLAIPVQYFWISQGWYGMFIVFIPVYMFLLLPLRMVLIGETKGFIKAVGTIHWALMLTVFCVSHIAYLLVLPIKNQAAGSIGLVIFILFMTQFNDVCQYVWGKILGKHKIIPKVSPNKTWEGFLGGLFSITICCGYVAPLLTPLTFTQGLLAGLLISSAGFVGDIVISSVKRDLQIKDSGTLIPGHGGVLDRLDSLTFTAPLFFHYIYFLVY
ncbi:MAG: phosphatidate cytidylyltransferase [Desulfobulbaceae bacterium]|nr:MAG: phosphatidate cytidylyltransferase [Desulfobulbaceae bacterium]